jgi:hypothetical protein
MRVNSIITMILNQLIIAYVDNYKAKAYYQHTGKILLLFLAKLLINKYSQRGIIMKLISSVFLIMLASLLPQVALAEDYTMTPDGSYVGGDSYNMTPDGSYVGGDSYNMTPDGSFVGGDSYDMTPDGSYVGQ